MTRTTSITRRVTGTVLLLELLAALCLVVAVTVHEYHVQLKAFEASMRGAADSLMGAVQDADDAQDNVLLDLHDVHVDPDSIYRVQEDDGRTLGSAGTLPTETWPMETFHRVRIGGRSYRMYTHHGERIVDPAVHGGVRHGVTILYGTPDGHVWHEVMEALRFFGIATVLLLGTSTVVMVALVRRWLRPIHDLAQEAGTINETHWQFTAPQSAKRTEELQPLAEALETALSRLQRSFEQQKRFTSDAAHELKTDLAIVKSSLQLLAMKRRVPEDYHRGLTLSLDDFGRLERTVYRMLTFARVEEGAEARERSCSLSGAMAEAIEQSRPLAVLREVTVQLDIASGHAMHVPLDARDALLLCSNLLLNAIQHSHASGSVVVHLREQGAEVSLTVRDHGEGVLPDDLPYLFDPFYRGDPSRSRKSGGTGLGLSICRAICTRAGGSITIGNHAGGGAAVAVSLPCVAAGDAAIRSAALKA